jgi:hypothetical protein
MSKAPVDPLGRNEVKLANRPLPHDPANPPLVLKSIIKPPPPGSVSVEATNWLVPVEFGEQRNADQSAAALGPPGDVAVTGLPDEPTISKLAFGITFCALMFVASVASNAEMPQNAVIVPLFMIDFPPVVSHQARILRS